MTIRAAVQFSGGAASYVAAKLTLAEFDRDEVALVFADTLIEDEDLYRFLGDVEQRLNHSVTRISDGRDPWQVFNDERMMGNTRADMCSRILKRELLDKWRKANAPEAAVMIGFDANEEHRLRTTSARMAPVLVRAPLIEHGIWREGAHDIVKGDGLTLPRLYAMGFAHNNCGGFCIKAGQGSFALLLQNFPGRYAEHEAKEEAFRAMVGKDVAIMRDRRGGETKPLTMKAFRERHQRQPDLTDMFDLGACNCIEPPEEPVQLAAE